MPQGEVVIVDAQGGQHIFPPGFDPRRAAAIVKQQSAPRSAAPGPTLRMFTDPRAGIDAGGISDVTGKPADASSEPDTYWGGFAKSIKDQIAGIPSAIVRNPAIQAAAHPTHAADLLPFVLPTGAPSILKYFKNVGGIMKDTAAEAPGVATVRRIANTATESARRRSYQPPTFEGPPAPRTYAPAPQGPAGPTISGYEGGAPTAPFHEQPLYQQMGDLPATEAPILRRGSGPPATPTAKPAGPAPRLNKPGSPNYSGPEPTLDDAIQQSLEDELTTPPPVDPRITSMDQRMTPAGKPAVTPEGYEDLVTAPANVSGRTVETPRPAPSPVASPAVANKKTWTAPEAPPEFTAPGEEGAMLQEGQNAAPGVLDQTIYEDAARRMGIEPIPDEAAAAQLLRARYGSEAAGKMSGVPKADIKTLTGPSTSVLPEAQRAKLKATWDSLDDAGRQQYYDSGNDIARAFLDTLRRE